MHLLEDAYLVLRRWPCTLAHLQRDCLCELGCNQGKVAVPVSVLVHTQARSVHNSVCSDNVASA